MSDNYLLHTYETFLKYPFGRQLFSAYSARRAPYFRSIKPLVTDLAPGTCTVLIRKRRSVCNHIGTMHAIAIANGLEMAMGFMTEASIPGSLRWIPKGMTLDYLAKSQTDIHCTATLAPEDFEPGVLCVNVTAQDSAATTVVDGVIQIWVSNRPADPIQRP